MQFKTHNNEPVKYMGLAAVVSAAVVVTRSIASGLLALFMFSSLLGLMLGISSALGLLVAAPLAGIMALAFFSLRESALYTRVLRLFNSDNIWSLLRGNNRFYTYESEGDIDDDTYEILCMFYYNLCSDLEVKLQQETNIALSKKQLAWNKLVFGISMLATVIESGVMFYSAYRVLSDITLLIAPSAAASLLPLVLIAASICAIGAFISFYGNSAVAIRNKLRYKHPISELKDKAKLGKRLSKLNKKLGSELAVKLEKLLTDEDIEKRFSKAILDTTVNSATKQSINKKQKIRCVKNIESIIIQACSKKIVPFFELNKHNFPEDTKLKKEPKLSVKKLLNSKLISKL